MRINTNEKDSYLVYIIRIRGEAADKPHRIPGTKLAVTNARNCEARQYPEYIYYNL